MILIKNSDNFFEAKGLVAIMNRLETGIMLQIWSIILIRLNKAICLQNSSLFLSTATNLLESLKESVFTTFSVYEVGASKYGSLSLCDVLQRTSKKA